eukprot:CAMPEP_0168212346 /NCGR_PEP_ID=MMETSP0140_2-20121125/4216_1 /TAXON_ID=44445 /ORGANISM="Pseudo-nitzschia australis, Strain 10249 10 AB" /LENGTH=159 /DNA_ID=CAMNT_0008139131 /DNA_START=100 /DNA_END=579 /DNA_ORIENTATION=+
MRSAIILLLCVFAVSGADIDISEWVVPPKSDPYYPSVDAVVGDTISFAWPEGITDVHIHPTGTCEEEGAILVGYASGASYTFVEEDAGKELFFASDVGRRCESGQNLKVSVSAPPAAAKASAIESSNNSAANGNGMSSALTLTVGFIATMILQESVFSF